MFGRQRLRPLLQQVLLAALLAIAWAPWQPWRLGVASFRGALADTQRGSQNNPYRASAVGPPAHYVTSTSSQQPQPQQPQAHSPLLQMPQSSFQPDENVSAHNALAQTQPSASALCATLPGSVARHLKLCKLLQHSSAAAQVVSTGASRGLTECRAQMRNERWNCTHVRGDTHLLTSELAQSLGARESAFVQAIAAAGIVHAVASACSTGHLADCECDKSRVGLIKIDEHKHKWKWGGCSNNIRHGMLFAKHLVELLDTYASSSSPTSMLSSDLSRRQIRRKRRAPDSPTQQPAAVVNICSRSLQQNITSNAHQQIIRSLLAKDSLSRHHEFRLMVNQHNNKIGRMAVARNMVMHCRCHGMSGTCSLKTCWLTLPSFKVIGDYLRRKYDTSIHLPTAVNVNKLIPMMNRAEVSQILVQSALAPTPTTAPVVEQQQPFSGSSSLPQPAALGINGDNDSGEDSSYRPSQHQPSQQESQQQVQQQPPPGPRPPFNLHFIHSTPTIAASTPAPSSTTSRQQTSSTSSASAQSIHSEEVEAAELSALAGAAPPLSPTQYQALLREMRLCNISSTVQPTPLWSTTIATLDGDTFGSYLTSRSSLGVSLGRQLRHLPQHASSSSSIPLQKRLQTGIRGASSLTHHMPHDRANHHAGSAGDQPQTHLPYSQHPHTIQQHQHQHPTSQQQLPQLSQFLQHQSKEELVHVHKSPDYCEANERHGFAGVQWRPCNNSKSSIGAPDSCDRLCCGRGYSLRTYTMKYECDCKFLYCCSVECAKCERRIEEPFCN